MRILVVDDNPELLELVVKALEREGHRVVSALTAAAATDSLHDQTFDVIVLDLGLPDGSGLDICRSARAAGVITPILILTARSTIDQRVEGLDAGADDFVTKPFAVAELRARIRALGRRTGIPAPRNWTYGDVELDFLKRRATVGGSEITLTSTEWRVIDVLARAHGQVVARVRILEEVWGDDEASSAASLDVLMTRIRKKLGPAVVRTVRGEGYALS